MRHELGSRERRATVHAGTSKRRGRLIEALSAAALLVAPLAACGEDKSGALAPERDAEQDDPEGRGGSIDDAGARPDRAGDAETDAGASEWERAFGSRHYVTSVAADRDGNVIVAGRGQKVGVQGVGWLPLTPLEDSVGTGDAFVRKYDAAGRLLWSKRFGAASDDDVYDNDGRSPKSHRSDARAVVDDAGNVLIAWHDEVIAYGDTSSYRTFVSKWDPRGNEVWKKLVNSYVPGASSYGVLENDIASDASGNVIVAGRGFARAGSPPDVFVRKYAPNGTELWTETRSITGHAWIGCNPQIAVDSNGHVVLSTREKMDPSGRTLWGPAPSMPGQAISLICQNGGYSTHRSIDVMSDGRLISYVDRQGEPVVDVGCYADEFGGLIWSTRTDLDATMLFVGLDSADDVIAYTPPTHVDDAPRVGVLYRYSPAGDEVGTKSFELKPGESLRAVGVDKSHGAVLVAGVDQSSAPDVVTSFVRRIAAP